MNEDGAVSKAPGTTPGVADSSPALGAGGFGHLGGASSHVGPA